MNPDQERYTLEPSRIATGSDEEAGAIVRVDGLVVAILIKLDAPYYQNDRGFWYLEIGFGACAGTPAPFRTLPAALLWIAEQLGDEQEGLAERFSEAGQAFTQFAELGIESRSRH